MNAGRELDALVAEKVMGWCSVSKNHHWNYVQGWPAGWPTEYSGLIPGQYTGDDEFKRDYNIVQNYSTSIAEAWLVVEKMMEEQFQVSVISPNDEAREWCVMLYHRGYRQFQDIEHRSVADTAPLAICLAALKACGVEVEKETI